jgi:hypothetical protein
MTHKLQIIFSPGSIFTHDRGRGGFQLISETGFYQGHYLACRLTPSNISRGHYLPGAFGGGSLLLIVQPIPFIRVTIYPAAFHNTVLAKVTIYLARFTTLLWLVSRPLFQFGCFAFAII